ncbi:hypothetical protein [Rossellomorea aquimaris]|uniref:hypothetical protein n=1 Tax=Rossellomorea aquimaris TaxID=189382 RepID=UPI0007D08F05|nr:hypothetical protein [Rossellomorea aquimaris]
MESQIETSFIMKGRQMHLLKMGMLLGIDILFATLILTILFTKEAILTQYVPLLCTAFLSLLMYLVLSTKHQRMNNILLYAVLLLLFGIGFFVFSISWLVLTPLLLFLHLKSTSYFQSEDPSIEVSSGMVLVFLFLSSFAILVGAIRDLGNVHIIYGLLFLLFTLIGTITPLQRMMSNENKGVKKNYFKPFAILTGIVSVGALLAAVSSMVAEGIYWVLSKIFWMFSFLVNPILNALIVLRDKLMSLIDNESQSGMGVEMQKQNLEEFKQKAFYESFSFPWLNEIFIGIVIVLVIIYFVRKRKIDFALTSNEAIVPVIIPKSIHRPIKEGEGGNIPYSKAKNIVRKSMVSLEDCAADHQVGRRLNENVRPWFKRMNLIENEEFFSLYESVRYGRKVPTQEEVDFFIKRIQVHVASLKERDKTK